MVFKCLDVFLGLIIDGHITANDKAKDIAKALQIELYQTFGKPVPTKL